MNLFTKFRNYFLHLILCFLVGVPSFSQSTVTTPAYLYREYMKVEPGMEADYIKLEKSWKKVHNKRKSQGNILEWAMYRRIFPSGTDAEYDYMTVTVFANGEKYRQGNAMTWDYIVQMMDQSDMATMENTDKYRKIVDRCMDMTLEQVRSNGQFIQITRMQTNPGQSAEFERMEKMMKPVYEEAAKMDKISSWRFGKRLYPVNSESGDYYQIITTNNMNNMFMGTADYLETAFKKVYPGRNFEATIKSLEGMTTVVNVELWESMDRTN